MSSVKLWVFPRPSTRNELRQSNLQSVLDMKQLFWRMKCDDGLTPRMDNFITPGSLRSEEVRDMLWWILTFICCSAGFFWRSRVPRLSKVCSVFPFEVQSESYIHLRTDTRPCPLPVVEVILRAPRFSFLVLSGCLVRRKQISEVKLQLVSCKTFPASSSSRRYRLICTRCPSVCLVSDTLQQHADWSPAVWGRAVDVPLQI